MFGIRIKNLKTKLNNDGLASIFITMIIMVIVSLILIGFVQYSNNEQKQSLDRQLQTEAFYTAESGINQVAQDIKTNNLAGTYNSKQCIATSPLFYFTTTFQYNNIVSKIPCLYINTQPLSLSYSNITVGNYKVARVESSQNISSIRIFWQNSNLNSSAIGIMTSKCLNAGNPLPPGVTTIPLPPSVAGNCLAGILRIDIVSSQNISNNLSTLFLYPKQSNQQTYTNINYTNLGIQDGSCNQSFTSSNPWPEYCEATINLPSNNNKYFLRIVPIYLPANVTIEAFDSKGNQQPFINGQTIVDSTGEAASTLQRIRVRLSIGNSQTNGAVPIDALDSTRSICKQIAFNGSTVFDDGSLCPSL